MTLNVMTLSITPNAVHVKKAMETPKTNPVRYFIQELRDAMKISQQGLAVHLGKSVRTVARWETDKPPGLKVLVQLEELAESLHRPDIASGFRSAVRKSLRIEEEQPAVLATMNVDETFWTGAMVDVLRNAELPGMYEHCLSIYRTIHSAYADLCKIATDGKSTVSGEELLGNLETMETYYQVYLPPREYRAVLQQEARAKESSSRRPGPKTASKPQKK